MANSGAATVFKALTQTGTFVPDVAFLAWTKVYPVNDEQLPDTGAYNLTPPSQAKLFVTTGVVAIPAKAASEFIK